MTKNTRNTATPVATAPTAADFEALRAELRKAKCQYLDATEYGSSVLFDLGTMFEAIRDLAGKDSQIGKLAGIGRYLAEDWGNSLDCQREEAQAEIDATQGGAA